MLKKPIFVFVCLASLVIPASLYGLEDERIDFEIEKFKAAIAKIENQIIADNLKIKNTQSEIILLKTKIKSIAERNNVNYFKEIGRANKKEIIAAENAFHNICRQEQRIDLLEGIMELNANLRKQYKEVVSKFEEYYKNKTDRRLREIQEIYLAAVFTNNKGIMALAKKNTAKGLACEKQVQEIFTGIEIKEKKEL